MAMTPNLTLRSSFTGANENPLSEGGAWTTGIQTGTALKRVSNAVTRQGASGSFSRDGSWYNALTFAAGKDCEAGMTLTTIGSDGALEAVLWNSTNVRGYSLAAELGGFGPGGVSGFALKRTGADIATTTAFVPAATDKICVQIDGNDIVGWLFRSGSWTEILRVADTTFRDAFNPGIEIAGLNDVTPGVADDFFAETPLRIVVPAAVSSTATVSAAVVMNKRVIVPASVGSTSTVTGSVVMNKRVIVPASVLSTSTVSATVSGGSATVVRRRGSSFAPAIIYLLTKEGPFA